MGYGVPKLLMLLLSMRYQRFSIMVKMCVKTVDVGKNATRWDR